jgi:nitrogenase molybdenum-iron protein NifN
MGIESVKKAEAKELQSVYKSGALVNSCKLCSPLGASLVYKGILRCIPLLHGSQGCATYIRRYLISHYREPVDIASSNFSESSTIFGGESQFHEAINNVWKQYEPAMIGVASTCVSDTIGEDVDRYIQGLGDWMNAHKTQLVYTSTPSYQGCHEEGYWRTVYSVVKTMCTRGLLGGVSIDENRGFHLNIVTSMGSPADLRHLKRYVQMFGLSYTLFPDYSETMDNPTWNQFKLFPEGGTTTEEIAAMGLASATIEMGIDTTKRTRSSAGVWLQNERKVPLHRMLPPIGVRLNDEWVNFLRECSAWPVPSEIKNARGRLLDSMADGHKYVFGKKAVLVGELDFCAAMCSFFAELGIVPVIVATAGRDSDFPALLQQWFPKHQIRVFMDADYESVRELGREYSPDLIVGNSKGQVLASDWNVPVIRCGFPVHDRVGGPRFLHYGYEGAQNILDQIINALLDKKQKEAAVEYKYM